MTDAQAAQIKELRMGGMGYRTIAEAVGLSRDIEEPAGEDGGRRHLYLLRKRDHPAGKRQAEEVLLGQVPEAVVENTSGGREQESGLYKSMCILRQEF